MLEIDQVQSGVRNSQRAVLSAENIDLSYRTCQIVRKLLAFHSLTDKLKLLKSVKCSKFCQ